MEFSANIRYSMVTSFSMFFDYFWIQDFTRRMIVVENVGVAELADAADLKFAGLKSCTGSIPVTDI